MTTKQMLGVLVFVIMGAIMVWQMYRDIGWKGVAWVLWFVGTIVGSIILGVWLLESA